MKQALLAIALLSLLGCQKTKPAAQNAPGAGVFGNNTIDDVFTVRELNAGSAKLEGTPKDLKAGDSLYFVRSPFKFAVASVGEAQVTITLPEKHDLAMGNTLFRHENDQVRKGIVTEKRLKEAVGD